MGKPVLWANPYGGQTAGRGRIRRGIELVGIDDEAVRVVAAAWRAQVAEEAAILAAEVADTIQVEFGRSALCDRLRAHSGRELTIRVTGMDAISGSLDVVEGEWLRMTAPGLAHYVAIDKIETVEGLGEAPEVPPGLPPRGWTQLLRQFADAGRAITVATVTGGRVSGRVVRAGRDHFDIGLSNQCAGDRGRRLTVSTATIAAIWVR